MPQFNQNRRLISQEDSAHIERANVPRSTFMNSWNRKTAFDAAYLVPFLVDEILPGDHMTYDVTAYVRMSTPLFPMFDNQRIDTFFFYVPCRLLWANWVRFMGEQDSPGDAVFSYIVPNSSSPAGGYDVGSLHDHMGIPPAGQIDAAGVVIHNNLPFRAYNLIYNTWFRDQNVINSVTQTTGDGPDSPGNYNLLRRAKSHDYFTSALPWPQKFAGPTIPLHGNAPISGFGTSATTAGTGPLSIRETGGASANYGFFRYTDPVNVTAYRMTAATGAYPDVYANLAAVTGVPPGVALASIRQAFLVQQLIERDARGGTRYVELIRSHFGVINPDFRLQRPEYIGGGQTPLQITPVAQTAPTAGLPVGALGAAGTAAGNHKASFAATEHGYIIGLINVRSELTYQQGMHKMWSRSTRYDFYWPALAQVAEQGIARKEIYITGIQANDDIVFGYQERWHEYRTRVSETTGIMRSTESGTIDMWHLGQEFSGAPTLSQSFIEEAPPMARVLAAADLADGQQYLADILIRRRAVRPIPTFGTPALFGRF